MLFELYDAGHTSAFEILVACLISVRTRDEVSWPRARQLFERARTPREMAELDINEIDALIGSLARPGLMAQAVAPPLGAFLLTWTGADALWGILAVLAVINLGPIGGLWRQKREAG